MVKVLKVAEGQKSWHKRKADMISYLSTMHHKSVSFTYLEILVKNVIFELERSMVKLAFGIQRWLRPTFIWKVNFHLNVIFLMT